MKKILVRNFNSSLLALIFLALLTSFTAVTLNVSLAQESGGNNSSDTSYSPFDIDNPIAAAENNFISNKACRLFKLARTILFVVLCVVTLVLSWTAIVGKISPGTFVTLFIAGFIIVASDKTLIYSLWLGNSTGDKDICSSSVGTDFKPS